MTEESRSLNRSASAITRNALVGYATLILGSLLGFVTTPVLLSALGVRDFGLYSVALGAAAYVALLESGLGTTALTRVAAVEADGQLAVENVLNACRLLLLASAALALVPLLILAAQARQLFHVQGHSTTFVAAAVVLAGVSQLLSFGSAVYSAALIGTGRQYVLTSSGFAVSTATTLCQIAVVALGGNLLSVLGALALGALVNLGVLKGRTRHHLPGVSVRARSASGDVIRNLWRSSWRNGVSQAAGSLAFGSDVLIVGLLLSARAAASYAVAQKAIILARGLSTKVADGLTPIYAHTGMRDVKAQFQLYQEAVSFSWVLAFPFGVALIVFSAPLLELWLGNVPSGAAGVLTLLGLLLCIQIPGHNAFILLQGLERLRLLTRLSLLAASVNVIGSAFLTMRFGLEGPALGSLLGVFVVDCALLPVVLGRVLCVRPIHLVRSVLLRPSAAMATTVALAMAYRVGLDPTGFVVLPLSATLVLTYGAVWLSTGASSRQRKLVSRLAGRLFPSAP